MQTIYSKLAASDIIDLATPVYIDRMNSQMKAVIDRCYALLQLVFEIRDGHTRHSRRPNFKPGKMVLVSTCGHPELDNFGPLVSQVKAICRNLDREYAGALLRPIAWFLPRADQMGASVDDIYQAAKDAGQQLLRDGRIKAQTLVNVSRDIISRERFVESINANIQTILDRLGEQGRTMCENNCRLFGVS